MYKYIKNTTALFFFFNSRLVLAMDDTTYAELSIIANIDGPTRNTIHRKINIDRVKSILPQDKSIKLTSYPAIAYHIYLESFNHDHPGDRSLHIPFSTPEENYLQQIISGFANHPARTKGSYMGNGFDIQLCCHTKMPTGTKNQHIYFSTKDRVKDGAFDIKRLPQIIAHMAPFGGGKIDYAHFVLRVGTSGTFQKDWGTIVHGINSNTGPSICGLINDQDKAATRKMEPYRVINDLKLQIILARLEKPNGNGSPIAFSGNKDWKFLQTLYNTVVHGYETIPVPIDSLSVATKTNGKLQRIGHPQSLCVLSGVPLPAFQMSSPPSCVVQPACGIANSQPSKEIIKQYFGDLEHFGDLESYGVKLQPKQFMEGNSSQKQLVLSLKDKNQLALALKLPQTPDLLARYEVHLDYKAPLSHNHLPLLKLLPNLTSLKLYDQTLDVNKGKILSAIFNQHPTLIELDLSHNESRFILRDGGLMAIQQSMSALPHLKRLNLSFQRIFFGDNGFSTLSNILSHLISLEELDLRTMDIDTRETQFFSQFSKLTNLKRLKVGDNGLVGDFLKALQPLPNLQELYLGNCAYNGNRITGKKLYSLSQSQFQSSLQKLHVDDNPIDDKGLFYISMLSNIRELNISYTNITDKGFGEFKNLQRLTYLNVSGNELNGDFFAALQSLSNLEEIDACGNQITGKKLRVLPKSNLSNYLKYLVLGDDQIDDEGTRYLSLLPNLDWR